MISKIFPFSVKKAKLIKDSEVERILNPSLAIEVVENVFKSGNIFMPPKSYIYLDDGDIRFMPARVGDALGAKIISIHLENEKRGIPTVIGFLCLVSPTTGEPLAFIDANYLTGIRTAAVSAISIKYLFKEKEADVFFLGCGTQSFFQVMVISEVINIKKIFAYDISDEKFQKFFKFAKKFASVEKGNPEEVKADILITLTPSRKPIVGYENLKGVKLINALGADAPGKQELHPEILKKAKIIVDDLTQAIHSGEINVPIKEGKIKKEDIYGEISEIVSGKKIGRENDELIVFDSTGLGVLDVALGYELIKKRYHNY